MLYIKYIENSKVQKHINSALEYSEKLRSIGEVIPDEILIAILLTSLFISYKSFIRAIVHKMKLKINPSVVTIESVRQYLMDLGLDHQTTKSYYPFQNRVPRRKNMSFIGMSKSTLINSKLSKTFLSEDIASRAYFQT